MPATPEEALNLRRFGLIVANCILPGLGNAFFVSKKRFAITLAFVAFQLVLQNPFPYFAFLIGSIAYGLIEINNSPLALRVKEAARQAEEEAVTGELPANSYLGRGPEVDYATLSMKHKDELAARKLDEQWQDKEMLEQTNRRAAGGQFDPTVPLAHSWGEADWDPSASDQSWIKDQLDKHLVSSNHLESAPASCAHDAGAQTDPSSASLPVTNNDQDPWVQQITDPAAPLLTPSSKSHDPWQQQQTDPGAPLAVPSSKLEYQTLLEQQRTDPVIIQGLGEVDLLSTAGSSAPLHAGNAAAGEGRCHSCGYKRDHDYAFCPKCATMF